MVRIYGGPQNVSRIYGSSSTSSTNKTSKASFTSKKDDVSISAQAKSYQTVMKAVSEVPDIREDKVRELSEKINSGKYFISGQEIYDKIHKQKDETDASISTESKK